ncbi:MAG: DUF4293 domain-containing protein [Muribaculaceae bacterium]|nr:DUF4293 domain-containing protein [Muribaculaceae bacterium]
MIIQRWQSVMLLIACILMATFSFVSLGQFQTEDYSLNVTSLGIFYEGEATGTGASGVYASTYYFFALSLLTAVLPLITIFLFRNPKLQINLCKLELLLLIGVIATGVFESFYAIDGATLSWSSAVCAPFLAIAFTIRAWKFIKKDLNLLRSADRLR